VENKYGEINANLTLNVKVKEEDIDQINETEPVDDGSDSKATDEMMMEETITEDTEHGKKVTKKMVKKTKVKKTTSAAPDDNAEEVEKELVTEQAVTEREDETGQLNGDQTIDQVIEDVPSDSGDQLVGAPALETPNEDAKEVNEKGKKTTKKIVKKTIVKKSANPDDKEEIHSQEPVVQDEATSYNKPESEVVDQPEEEKAEDAELIENVIAASSSQQKEEIIIDAEQSMPSHVVNEEETAADAVVEEKTSPIQEATEEASADVPEKAADGKKVVKKVIKKTKIKKSTEKAPPSEQLPLETELLQEAPKEEPAEVQVRQDEDEPTPMLDELIKVNDEPREEIRAHPMEVENTELSAEEGRVPEDVEVVTPSTLKSEPKIEPEQTKAIPAEPMTQENEVSEPSQEPMEPSKEDAISLKAQEPPETAAIESKEVEAQPAEQAAPTEKAENRATIEEEQGKPKVTKKKRAPKPEITAEPAVKKAERKGSIVLEAAVATEAPVDVEWRKEGVPINTEEDARYQVRVF